MLQQAKQCEICGKMSSIGEPIDPHHVIHKSQGGTDHDHNVQTTCRTCHDSLHDKNGPAWKIVERSPERLLVMAGNEIVVDIPYPPQEWDQGEYIAQLPLIDAFLERATEHAMWLAFEGLEAAAEATRNMDKGIWIYQAELLYWAMRKVPRGTRVERINAIAEKMGYGQAYAYRLLNIREWKPDLVSTEYKLAPGFYQVALKQEDPDAALEMAVDRVAEDPRYTVRQFAREVKGEPTCGYMHQGRCDFHENVRCYQCPKRE